MLGFGGDPLPTRPRKERHDDPFARQTDVEGGRPEDEPGPAESDRCALGSLGEQGRVPIRTLHRRLSETGTPLSLVSIRQVLGRLVESGLVTLDEQDVYSPGKASWGGAAGSAAPERRAAANEQRL